MVKCEICKANIGETFLGKIKGTYVKDDKGKKHIVCFECQSKIKSKEDILKEF